MPTSKPTRKTVDAVTDAVLMVGKRKGGKTRVRQCVVFGFVGKGVTSFQKLVDFVADSGVGRFAPSFPFSLYIFSPSSCL